MPNVCITFKRDWKKRRNAPGGFAPPVRPSGATFYVDLPYERHLGILGVKWSSL